MQFDAGPDHLRELRDIIYPSLKTRMPGRPAGDDAHRFRASEGRAAVAALTALSLGVDVRLTCFERDMN